MKILIAGAGKVGTSLTEQLSLEGYDITIIDMKAKRLEMIMETYDVITMEGNSAASNVLKEAGVMDADLFIAATSLDEVNLLSCITAHTLNPELHTIARIRDPEYVEQAYEMRDAFGLKLVVNPERMAASEIARLLKYPGFLQRETFAKAKVEIVELRLDKKSRLNNVQVKNLQTAVRCQILICAVLRNGEAIMPDGDFTLRSGDRIFVTGDSENLHSLLRALGIITMPVNHVLVAGGSRISYYLAQELKKNNISVSIIENDEKKCETLAKILPYATIIHGDASDQNVLEEEEIGSYNGFVSMTGLDEINMVMSLYANMAGVPQIVTKLGRGENIAVLDRLGIGSAVCPKELCTMHIVRYVRAMRNQKGAAITVHKIADGQVEAMEFTVDENTAHIGEPLKDIAIRKNILIASVSHGSTAEIPHGNTAFHEGDTIIVLASAKSAINTINDIFEE
ncbi:MAG: Trk system potassium transporter TrkA [Solobacterium sp.]|nr:Trk system potassium transporter TrkA [Solobacterium sp.]